MNITQDRIYDNFDEKTIQLYYEATMDKNIYSGDTEGLTIEDIRRTISGPICRIFVDGEVVGIFCSGVVHISNYFAWGLKRNFHYSRIGYIYIDKKHRGKGYASKILGDHVVDCDRYAECCHEDNIASNAVLSKFLKFHKRAYIHQRGEYYNIYIKE